MPSKNAHEKIVEEALSRPGVRKEYDELDEEFLMLRELFKARQKAGKTQGEVARAMHTTTSVIGRLESAGGKRQHSPTLATLRKYAHALGCTLSIKLVPNKAKRIARK